MTPETARRFARQIALPEIGPEGQERIGAAEVLVVGYGLAMQTMVKYLEAAGMVGVRCRTGSELPAHEEAWVAAASASRVCVRWGIASDDMLRACVRVGTPMVFAELVPEGILVLSFRQVSRCPHLRLNTTMRREPWPPTRGPADIVAAALCAAEVLQILARPDEPPRARKLIVPANGSDPVVEDITWNPACPACGGDGPEGMPDE